MLRPMPAWNPEWVSDFFRVPSENTPLSAVLRRRPHGGQARFPPLPGVGRSRPFGTHCQRTFSAPRTALITHWPFSSKKLKIDVKEEPEKRDLSVEDLVRILKTETLPGKRMQLARDVLALSFYLLVVTNSILNFFV